MPLHLPVPLGAYFAADKAADADGFARCFAADATVHDERRTHVGHEAIKAWLAEGKASTQYAMEPLDVAERDGATIVSARVAGNFPNSPIVLELRFQIEHGLIARLDIH